MMSATRSLTFNQRSAAFREKVISSLSFSNRLAQKKGCEYVSESLVEMDRAAVTDLREQDMCSSRCGRRVFSHLQMILQSCVFLDLELKS